MTIAELREIVNNPNLPSDMLVGDTGHFGEFRGVDFVGLGASYHMDNNNPFSPVKRQAFNFLQISIESLGPEPD